MTISQIIVFMAFAFILTKVILSTIISKTKKKDYKTKKVTKVFLIILPILFIILQIVKCFLNECI